MAGRARGSAGHMEAALTSRDALLPPRPRPRASPRRLRLARPRGGTALAHGAATGRQSLRRRTADCATRRPALRGPRACPVRRHARKGNGRLPRPVRALARQSRLRRVHRAHRPPSWKRPATYAKTARAPTADALVYRVEQLPDGAAGVGAARAPRCTLVGDVTGEPVLSLREQPQHAGHQLVRPRPPEGVTANARLGGRRRGRRSCDAAGDLRGKIVFANAPRGPRRSRRRS